MKTIKQLLPAVCFLIFIMMLAGCTLKSENDAVNDAGSAAEKAFNTAKVTESNQNFNGFSLYIPDSLTVQDKSENNVVLKDGKQLIIVFDNQLEDPKSELSYQTISKNDALLTKTFKNDSEFGYIHILPDEGKGYELRIGIGGIKLTTFTTKGKMADDASKMMKIARSGTVFAEAKK